MAAGTWPTLERKLTPRTRGIVLINPNNPTGSLCTRRMLEQVAELARRHNLIVFSDEIYDKLILDGTAPYCLCLGGSRRPVRDLRWHVEELPCARMAYRMGHRFRRCHCC